MVREITAFVDGPISAEVISTQADAMVKEAIELCEEIKCENLVIKIPITSEGLKAVKVLSQKGIKTNVVKELSSSCNSSISKPTDQGRCIVTVFSPLPSSNDFSNLPIG